MMIDRRLLQRGDLIPHFEVRTIGGEQFSYSTIWQRTNLLLLTIPVGASDSPGNYVSQLVARRPEFTAKNVECVMTADGVSGVQSPAVVVVDKWGEIVHVETALQVDDLASPDELLDWFDYVERRCPECEGEAR
jgi:hypothetical protein